MSVRAYTPDSKGLLNSIKRGISEGEITSWSIDEDGDLTLSESRWSNKAWMRTRTLSDQLLFNIVGSTKSTLSTVTYAAFHAEIIKMLLIHFDAQMTKVSASAMPTSGDLIPEVTSE